MERSAGLGAPSAISQCSLLGPDGRAAGGEGAQGAGKGHLAPPLSTLHTWERSLEP